MIKVNDKVRFKEPEKDSQYGVLLVLEIDDGNEIATCTSADYSKFGGIKCNANFSESQKVEI